MKNSAKRSLLLWSFGLPLWTIVALFWSALDFAMLGGVAALIAALVAWIFGLHPEVAALRLGLLVGVPTLAISFCWRIVSVFRKASEETTKWAIEEATGEPAE